MPRPQKLGLDYFPLDTKMDDKLELIEAKYDIVGYAIIIKLWSKIYDNGYWYKWTEREKLLFRKQNNIDINLLNDIINDSLEWGIFSLDKYNDYEILTSNGIQNRYLHAIATRKNQEFIEEYCIFDINEYINSVNEKINVIKVSLNPHTKVKDTIPNQNKVNDTKEENKDNSDTSPIPQFALSLSKLIFSHSKTNTTTKQIEAGANVIYDLNRLDGYTEDEIKSVIEWALNHEFWGGVVQSPASLRKKKNGAGDITKFAKIYNQWKNKPETHEERMARLEKEQYEQSNG